MVVNLMMLKPVLWSAKKKHYFSADRKGKTLPASLPVHEPKSLVCKEPGQVPR